MVVIDHQVTQLYGINIYIYIYIYIFIFSYHPILMKKEHKYYLSGNLNALVLLDH